MSETDVVGMRLAQARDHVAAAARSLDLDATTIGQLHAAVDGAMRIATALTDLIATMADAAPPLLKGTHQATLDELQADLRAMRGCLVTGRSLLDPARADLAHLAHTDLQHAEQQPATQQNGATMSDPVSRVDIPDGDGADQHRPVCPDDDSAELAESDALAEAVVPEADPADVADQHRDAPAAELGTPVAGTRDAASERRLPDAGVRP